MFKLTNNVGSIYQVSSCLKNYLTDEFLIIQTKGIPIENAILCPYESKLQETLLRHKDQKKDVVLVGISSLEIDEELVCWLRKATCRGKNIYIFSCTKNKMWFVDQKLGF